MTKQSRVFIIAEAGVNHNGSPDMALRLVDEAAKAGVDAVKFQTFKAENIASIAAPKAAYQNATTDPGESQLAMLKKLELPKELHFLLERHCREAGLEFISTAFDLESLSFVDGLGVRRLKIPSGEITCGPLLLAAARTGKPILLSTGMCGLGDIEAALGVLAFGYLGLPAAPSLSAFAAAYASKEGVAVLQEKVTLLHCTTQYPAPPESVNLRALETLSHAFELPVGYSDHTEGTAAAVAAAALGAEVIEKHFTLDRSLPGPDHKASLIPEELASLVRMVRETEMMLGASRKFPSASETGNMNIARKSLLAARNMEKGDVFSEENLAFKRPGNGVSPMRYWEYLGKRAERAYKKDELL